MLNHAANEIFFFFFFFFFFPQRLNHCLEFLSNVYDYSAEAEQQKQCFVKSIRCSSLLFVENNRTNSLHLRYTVLVYINY